VQKVLVVDDESNIRHILEFSLDAEGFQVLSAADALEAFQTAVAETPDLIVLDVMMPGGDGIETCRRLKRDPRTRRIPIILLTARTSNEDRERGREAGADAYMTKPFSPSRLVEKVQSVLGVKN